MSYTDNSENKKILEGLNSTSTAPEVEKLINKYFPGWLICSLSGYSTDYPSLQENWKKVCMLTGAEPQKIVLVSDIFFNAEHTTLNTVCDFLTKNGYCVRRTTEFISCPKCNKAIPCQELWHLLKANKLPVPSVWKNECTTC